MMLVDRSLLCGSSWHTHFVKHFFELHLHHCRKEYATYLWVELGRRGTSRVGSPRLRSPASWLLSFDVWILQPVRTEWDVVLCRARSSSDHRQPATTTIWSNIYRGSSVRSKLDFFATRTGMYFYPLTKQLLGRRWHENVSGEKLKSHRGNAVGGTHGVSHHIHMWDVLWIFSQSLPCFCARFERISDPLHPVDISAWSSRRYRIKT